MTETMKPSEEPRDVRAAGLRLRAPVDWEVITDPTPGVCAVALEPSEQDGAFRTNLVVTVSSVDTDLESWQGAADDLLAEVLDDYRLLDLELVEVAGRPALRRLGHHRVDGRGVTLEQWSTLVGTRGHTFTFTAGDLAYNTAADVFGETVATIRDDQTQETR